jgi:Protein of unknown function (DUF4054)
MGVTVTFNYAQWLQLFPSFSYITQPQAQEYFNLATQVHRNDGGGPVTLASTQTNLLNLVTAHIASLLAPPPDNPGGPPARDAAVVGRITSASEGSVSVSTENSFPPGSSQWWQQTQYGAMYWQMSRVFRTARYLKGRPRVMNPFGFGTFANFPQFWNGSNNN